MGNFWFSTGTLYTEIVTDKEGYVYDIQDGKNAELLDGTNYQSAMYYGSYNGEVDLEGRAIDVVGNLH